MNKKERYALCNQKRRETRIKRIEQGLCVKCGGTKSGNLRRCEECAKNHRIAINKSRNKRPSKGLCRNCPATIADGEFSCAECKKKITAVTKLLCADRLKRGLCKWCGKQKITSRYCEKCWFNSRSSSLFGTIRYGKQMMEAFYLQNEVCFYSGEKLIIGQNASIDHQHPISRGGENVTDNLRWVTIQINRIKQDLTHVEFVDLCRRVSDKFKS